MQNEISTSGRQDGRSSSFPWKALGAFGFISTAVVLPILAHRHAGFGDFPSHVYNAYLSIQIEDGRAPGFWLAHRHSNVLTDWCLAWLMRHVTLTYADKLVLIAAVLIFFWGALAFIRAIAGRVSWCLLPLVAMLCYGIVFYLGFINFYVATGLSLLLIALALQDDRRLWLLAPWLGALIWLAHPFPLPWAIGTILYFRIARRPQRHAHLAIFLLSLIAIAVALMVSARFLNGYEHELKGFLSLGVFQLQLPGPAYDVIAVATLILATVLAQNWAQQRVRRERLTPPVTFCILMVILVSLAPKQIHVPGEAASLGFVVERLSFFLAVSGCAMLGSFAPIRAWSGIAAAVIATGFFVQLHDDYKTLNRVEARMEMLVHQLPPGQRVVSMVPIASHLLDRVCIAWCWSYADYEPASAQFQVRAAPRNGKVLESPVDVEQVQRATFRVRPQDTPLFFVFQCGERPMHLCMRELKAGETLHDVSLLEHTDR